MMKPTIALAFFLVVLAVTPAWALPQAGGCGSVWRQHRHVAGQVAGRAFVDPWQDCKDDPWQPGCTPDVAETFSDPWQDSADPWQPFSGRTHGPMAEDPWQPDAKLATAIGSPVPTLDDPWQPTSVDPWQDELVDPWQDHAASEAVSDDPWQR
jgi:hypothetical protein